MHDVRFYECDALANVLFQNAVIENIEKLGRVPGHTTVDSFASNLTRSIHVYATKTKIRQDSIRFFKNRDWWELPFSRSNYVFPGKKWSQN